MAGRTKKVKTTKNKASQRIGFYHYASTLLPHEIEFLWRNQYFKTNENLEIITRLYHSVRTPDNPPLFNNNIDKRHYSYVRKWIEDKLSTIDADAFFGKLIEYDKKVMTDALSAEDERDILRMIKKSKQTDYHFVRFYELIQNYRYYLLIRMRYNYLKTINQYLETQHEAWVRSKAINQELHEATRDIVDQYVLSSGNSKHWEARLISIFEDDTLDGLNRYYAIVRLTFMYYNYKEYSKLLELYKQLDELIYKGLIYSRRILANYYANRLLIHSRLHQNELAIYYGRLSVRHKSSDYLFYLTNLCSVLLRAGHYEEALQKLRSSLPEYRITISPHNRIGFASLYVQSLVFNGKAQQALSFAKQFLETHRDELFQFRWHLFFTSMMLALFRLGRYREIIRLTRRYGLIALEQGRRNRAAYIPYLQWFYELARYKECMCDEQTMYANLRASSEGLWQDPHRARLLLDLLAELRRHAPELSLNLIQIT